MSSFTKIPSFLFIFILWSILPLPGEIFRATSEDEACQYLEKVYGKIENIRNDAMLFVDIDETLIHNSSDIGSYQKHGDLRAVEAINGKLIELLRQLKDIKIVGITSSRTQTLNISPQNNLPQNDQDCFLNLVPILISVDPRGVSTTEKTTERKVQQTASWIRSKALTSAKSPCLHLPLFNPYPNRTISLPLATQLVPDLPPATDDFPLRNLQYNSATEVTLHRYFSPFLQKACFDLYVQGEKKGEETQTYGKIIACPTYENGVIFSNFFHLSEAWQKGLPMRAFLSFFSKKFLRTPLKTILAIDDNVTMLISMENQCRAMGLSFCGIHLNYPPKPVIWIFCPPPEGKRNTAPAIPPTHTPLTLFEGNMFF